MSEPVCCNKKMKRLFQTSAWDCEVCGTPKYDPNLSEPNKKSIARLNSMEYRAKKNKKNNKITAEDTLLIRQFAREGLSINKIANKFNIGWSHCKDIIEKGAVK
jgi:hypothetical protein